MKRFVLALALIAAPLAAAAECSSPGHEQAMSCAENMMWDQETRTCVPLVVG